MRMVLRGGYHLTAAILLLVLGLFAVPASANYVPMARAYKAYLDLGALSSALQLFHSDFNRYPTTQEGLGVLTQPTTDLLASGKYPSGGYIEHLPHDPWGTDYQYRQPGIKSDKGYDLWSYGADGLPGGHGLDADIGNWPGSVEAYKKAASSDRFESDLIFGLISGLVLGSLLGLPASLLTFFWRRRRRADQTRTGVGPYVRIWAVWVGASAVFMTLFALTLMD